MRRRTTKRDAERLHARIRARERYGIELGEASRSAIIRSIQTGTSTIVERQTNRVSVHDVDLDGQVVRVVYDRARKELVTFLPRSA
ncbi:MAG TPA: hypothetical protein VF244_10975 [Acidimicrobiales bacterium]